MERHAEIGKHTIHTIHVIVAHEVGDEAEIGIDHGESRKIRRSTLHGIEILVKRIEPASEPGGETLHYRARVAAPSVGGIDIDPSGTDVEGFEGFRQQRRHVIDFAFHLLDFTV